MLLYDELMQDKDETLIIRRSILAKVLSVIITLGIGFFTISFLSHYMGDSLDSLDFLDFIFLVLAIGYIYYSFWHDKIYINSEGIQPHDSDNLIPWNNISAAKLIGFTLLDGYISVETNQAEEPIQIPWPMNKPNAFFNICRHHAAADNPLVTLLEKLLHRR